MKELTDREAESVFGFRDAEEVAKWRESLKNEDSKASAERDPSVRFPWGNETEPPAGWKTPSGSSSLGCGSYS